MPRIHELPSATPEWDDEIPIYDASTHKTSKIRLGSLQTLIAGLPEYVFNSYAWQYSNQVPPATGNQVRLNNTDATKATLIDIRRLDADDADRTPMLQQVTEGSQIRINDWNDASKIHRFKVNGPVTFGTTNVQIPVEWQSGDGTIPNAKVNVAFLVVLQF